MLKKFGVAAILIIFTQLFIVTAVHATDVLKGEQKQIKQEKVVVQQELEKAQKELNELLEERHSLEVELESLNESIEQFNTMIKDLEKKIGENEQQLASLEIEMEKLQEELDYRHELLTEKAVLYQKSGTSISYLQVIFGAESFSDFISRLISLTKISLADSNFIKQTLAKQDELKNMEENFTKKRDELQEKLQEIEVMHEIIHDEQSKISLLLNERKEIEKEQEKLISQLVQKENELGLKEKDIRKKMEEALKRQEEERRAKEKAKRRAENKSQQQNSNDRNLVTRGIGTEKSIIDNGSWQTFIATAYTANCNGCSGITYTGINLKKNRNAKVIAVDPTVIPLGSKVEIEGLGTYLAADIGTAIKGKKIDIFIPDKNAAMNFGYQKVKLRIIN